MKRLLLTTGLLILTSFVINAQNYYETVPEEITPEKRVYFGGNFSAGYRFNGFQWELSPQIGYRLTPKMAIGGGLSYKSYFREYQPLNQPRIIEITQNYGVTFFSRYRLTSMIFTVVEYERLNVQVFTNAFETERDWVPGFLAGAGLYQPFGLNKALSIALMYNFLYDSLRSPYNNAVVVRLGVTM